MLVFKQKKKCAIRGNGFDKPVIRLTGKNECNFKNMILRKGCTYCLLQEKQAYTCLRGFLDRFE